MGPVGQADRFLGRYQGFEFIGHGNVDGIGTTQGVAFQKIVLLVNEQVEEQGGHGSNTRTLAYAQQGGIHELCPGQDCLDSVHQGQAAVVVEMQFERSVRIAFAQSPHAAGYHRRAGHANRVWHT